MIKYICALLICLSSICQSQEVKIITNLYTDGFVIDGYEFLYSKNKLNFPLIVGDPYLIEYEEPISLSNESYKMVATITSSLNGESQQFTTPILSKSSTGTIAKILSVNNYAEQRTGPSLWGRGGYIYGVVLNYVIELEDGRQYTLEAFFRRENMEEAQKLSREVFLSPGMLLELKELGKKGSIRPWRINVLSNDALCKQFSMHAKSAKRNDSFGDGLNPVVALIDGDGELSPNDILFQEGSFDLYFQVLNFEFFHQELEYYLNRKNQGDKIHIIRSCNYHDSDQHVAAMVIYYIQNGKKKRMFLDYSLFNRLTKQSKYQYLTRYEKDGLNIFMFRVLKNGNIAEFAVKSSTSPLERVYPNLMNRHDVAPSD